MTPTVNDLREVGLRPNMSMLTGRDYSGTVARYDVVKTGSYRCFVPVWGQRTLGEYWRRRRMLEWQTLDFRRHMGSEDSPSQPIEVYATEECRNRRWKAWPKPGWSKRGKGRR